MLTFEVYVRADKHNVNSIFRSFVFGSGKAILKKTEHPNFDGLFLKV